MPKGENEISEKKTMLHDEQMEQVIGGLFVFHKKSQILTFTHQDGSVSEHKMLDFDNAWESYCRLDAQNWDEEKILLYLVSKNFIKTEMKHSL